MDPPVLKIAGLDKFHKEIDQTCLSTFTLFYKQMVSQIYAYLFYRTDNESDAEDLCAETFERVYKNWDTLRINNQERIGWLFRVAHNLVVDYQRKMKWRRWLNLNLLKNRSGDDEGPERYTINLEEHERLCIFLSFLSNIEKEVVALRFSTDFSYQEIASLLRLSEANVGTILHRSIKKLRSLYGQQNPE